MYLYKSLSNRVQKGASTGEPSEPKPLNQRQKRFRMEAKLYSCRGACSRHHLSLKRCFLATPQPSPTSSSRTTLYTLCQASVDHLSIDDKHCLSPIAPGHLYYPFLRATTTAASSALLPGNNPRHACVKCSLRSTCTATPLAFICLAGSKQAWRIYAQSSAITGSEEVVIPRSGSYVVPARAAAR